MLFSFLWGSFAANVKDISTVSPVFNKNSPFFFFESKSFSFILTKSY